MLSQPFPFPEMPMVSRLLDSSSSSETLCSKSEKVNKMRDGPLSCKNVSLGQREPISYGQ